MPADNSVSEEQIELFRAMLAELKSNGQATADFRKVLQETTAKENAAATEMRVAWYAEVRSAQRHRLVQQGVLAAMLLSALVLFGILWAFAPLWRSGQDRELRRAAFGESTITPSRISAFKGVLSAGGACIDFLTCLE